MLEVIKYYVKFLFIYFSTIIRSFTSKTATTGYGERKLFTNYEKESVRKTEDKFSIDASYFNGVDFQGNFFGFGMQKRPENRCESIFFLRIREFSNEPLVLAINPSTWVHHDNDRWSTNSGLVFEMLIPMVRWRVSYSGEVVKLHSRSRHMASFIFEWNCTTGVYDTDKDIDKVVISRAIASQPWSRKFFDNLRELHQTHYEVYGEIKVEELSVDTIDYKREDMRLTSMKDRSYGVHRNWGDFRRYILHYLTTEDGQYIGCHFVSITKTFNHLLVGFVMDKNGKKVSVRRCNKTLSDIGENKLLIDDAEGYNYRIEDVNGQVYDVTVKVEEYVKFHCGNDEDGTLFSSYVTGSVNGVKMVGLCEYEYNSAQFRSILA